ncbi:MAG: site-specific DNA-methyltransferase [Acholeplasmatales bacterium]|jgi:site-specific DNA-methyltransferase (adenine-specific)|nr:site-specific DNA-methyltransferase [Acholeplasmatales bacterium]
MKTNIIINGDSLLELKKIEDSSIDLIFADPPYWMRTTGTLQRVEGTVFNGVNDEWDKFDSLEAYEQFTTDYLKECKRILKKDGSIWIIGGMQCIYTIGAIMQRLGFWIINDVVWHKTNPTPNFMGTRLNNSHETLIWATKSEKSKYTFNYKTAKELNIDFISQSDYNKGVRKQLGSVWRLSVCNGNERIKDSDGNKLHSTQKPEELLYRIIAICTNLGDTVLDPFGGTMTTAAVAKKMGRNYIMIEKDSNYCKYGKERVDKVVTNITNIESSSADIKPLKVSLEEMIINNFFINGELFYLKNSPITAILLENGKLLYKEEVYDMHTLAAKAGNKKALRLNGFDYWFVKRNNELISIDVIRQEYRNSR